jgi:hypothetical protein
MKTRIMTIGMRKIRKRLNLKEKRDVRLLFKLISLGKSPCAVTKVENAFMIAYGIERSSGADKLPTKMKKLRKFAKKLKVEWCRTVKITVKKTAQKPRICRVFLK